MRSNTYLGSIVAVFLLFPTAVEAAPWQITQTSGQVFLGTGTAQPVAVAKGAIVPEGATLTTGPNGRAALVRGTETMIVSPGTVLSIPAEIAGRTTILERKGVVVFDVEKKNVQHFAVETPFLAAVVKGTRFTVRVDEAGAGVDVERGLVEVTNLASGEVTDVPAGQRAGVAGPGGHLSVGGFGQEAEIRQGTPRQVMVAALGAGEVAVAQNPAAAAAIGPADRRESRPGEIAPAAGSGGPGPGGTGGPDGAGVSGADFGIAVAGGFATLQTAAVEGPTDPLEMPKAFKPRNRVDDFVLTDMAIACMIALSAFLAFGIAFLRARLR